MGRPRKMSSKAQQIVACETNHQIPCKPALAVAGGELLRGGGDARCNPGSNPQGAGCRAVLGTTWLLPPWVQPPSALPKGTKQKAATNHITQKNQPLILTPDVTKKNVCHPEPLKRTPGYQPPPYHQLQERRRQEMFHGENATGPGTRANTHCTNVPCKQLEKHESLAGRNHISTMHGINNIGHHHNAWHNTAWHMSYMSWYIFETILPSYTIPILPCCA